MEKDKKFDLEGAIHKAVDDLKDSGHLEKVITESIQKNITDVLNSAIGGMFGWNGKLRKTIQEVIESQMQISTGEFTLPSYRETIINMVADELKGAIEAEGSKKTKEAIAELIKRDVPVELEFKKIIEKVVEEARHFSDELDGEITVHLDDGNGKTLNFIHMDEESGLKTYECSHKLVLKPLELATEKQDWFKIHSYNYNGRKYNTSDSFGQDKTLGRWLFELYCAGTKIHYNHEEIKGKLEELSTWDDRED